MSEIICRTRLICPECRDVQLSDVYHEWDAKIRCPKCNVDYLICEPELAKLDFSRVGNLWQKFEQIDRLNRNNLLVHTWADIPPLAPRKTRTQEQAEKQRRK